jgi:hypothetical protein
LSFNYTSTWASIQELEAASEDEIVFSNIYAINTYCENNGIKAEHSIS